MIEWFDDLKLGMHFKSGEVTVSRRRYREGTLVIDIIDAKTHNLVWRGSMVDPVDDPARMSKQFAESAREIIEKFPDGSSNVSKS